MPKLIPINPGHTFGRLTVLENQGKNSQGRYLFLCKCECGKEKSIAKCNLIKGKTTSCGCYGAEQRKAANLRNANYLWKKPEYKVWAKMKERCLNPNCKDYRNYGGRGISISARWLNSFANFYADMGDRPFKGAELDRIEKNGNYEPGNCRWATKRVQSRNRRTNRLIEWNGITMCLTDWSEKTGIPRLAIWNRLNVGWSIEKALTLPPDHTVTQFKRKAAF